MGGGYPKCGGSSHFNALKKSSKSPVFQWGYPTTGLEVFITYEYGYYMVIILGFHVMTQLQSDTMILHKSSEFF